MKLLTLFALVLLPFGVIAAGQPTTQPMAPASTHAMMKAATLQWGEAPPGLERGAQIAVLSGDPGQPAPFVLRLKLPPGYKIATHWHPTDEHVTVLEGDLTLAMGDGAQAHSATFGPGDYVLLPARMPHAASTQAGAVAQLHCPGPFAINYVDPKDDPRNRMPAGDKKAAKRKP